MAHVGDRRWCLKSVINISNLLPKYVTLTIKITLSIEIIFECRTSNLDQISGLGIVKITWGRLGSCVLPWLEFWYYSKSVTLCDIFEKLCHRDKGRLQTHKYKFFISTWKNSLTSFCAKKGTPHILLLSLTIYKYSF